jgi:Phosphoribosyl-AMP cyclohydrolase
MDDLNKFFEKSELIPTIIQDVSTLEVLMLAYMSRESLIKTLDSGETWFWSRSRAELWHKGATSGHIQHVREVRYDCDCDTLLVLVDQVGAACHTGNRSCFYRKLNEDAENGKHWRDKIPLNTRNHKE